MHPININNIFHVNHISFPLQGFSLYTYYRQCKPWPNGSNVYTGKEAAQFASISLSSYPAKCNSQWDRDVGLGISPNCASVVTGMSGSVWKRGRDSNKQASIYFTLWRPSYSTHQKVMNSVRNRQRMYESEMWVLCLWLDTSSYQSCYLHVALYPFHAV